MKLTDLLKLPMMEDQSLGGVIDTTCLNDVDVTYMSNAFQVNDLSLEEKRDFFVDVLKKADATDGEFDPDVFYRLCLLGNNYSPTEEEVEDEVVDYVGNTR